MTETFDVFTRESSYCFQRVLRRLSHRNSVRLSVCPSVRHGWISQKRCKL